MTRREFNYLVGGAAGSLLVPVAAQGAIVWDQARFESSYRINSLGRYDRTFPPQSMYQRRCDKLLELAPQAPISRAFLPGDRILIGGCGFGQLVDCFKAAGFPNTWGVDGGPYIADNAGLVAPGTIVLLENIRGGGQFRARLRSETGDDTFDWIISESMLEGAQTDNEVLAALSFIEGIQHGTTISLHMVVPLSEGQQDPDFLWKSMADWRTLFDSDQRTQENLNYLVNLQTFGVY